MKLALLVCLAFGYLFTTFSLCRSGLGNLGISMNHSGTELKISPRAGFKFDDLRCHPQLCRVEADGPRWDRLVTHLGEIEAAIEIEWAERTYGLSTTQARQSGYQLSLRIAPADRRDVLWTCSDLSVFPNDPQDQLEILAFWQRVLPPAAVVKDPGFPLRTSNGMIFVQYFVKSLRVFRIELEVMDEQGYREHVGFRAWPVPPPYPD